MRGAWYESFERLSRQANIEFHYEFVSVSRLEFLLKGMEPGCSLTLIKTPARLEKKEINFIVDHAKKTILRTYQRADDDRKLDLKELQENKKILIASNTPAAMDALKENGIHAEMYPKINSIIRMLASKRIDVFAGSNLAVEAMDEFKSGRLRAGVTLKTLTHGIGCSRGTPLEVTERLKQAARTWTL